MRSLACLLVLAAGAPVLGHFVYIVPASGGKQVQIVFSDTLAEDEKINSDKIATTKLFAIGADGETSPLTFKQGDHSLSTTVTPTTRLVLGITDYGVAQSKHTGNIPVRITYHSRVILGDPSKIPAAKAPSARVDVVPTIDGGKLTFTALQSGKPLAKAGCVVLIPGETKGQRGTTDADGKLPGEFSKPGRYGAWVRAVDETAGEHKGKKYDKSHTYGTLVIDFGSAR